MIGDLVSYFGKCFGGSKDFEGELWMIVDSVVIIDEDGLEFCVRVDLFFFMV